MSVDIKTTWTIVEFIKDNSVEAIPTNWISGTKCVWPRYARDRLLKAIKSCDTPLPSWDEHEISSFRNATYGDYMKARKKCQKAEETSDLNSENETVRKIKAPARLRTSSESSSDQSEVDVVDNKSETSLPQCPLINLKQSVPEKVPETVMTSTMELHNNAIEIIPQRSSISLSVPGTTTTRQHQCHCCPEHSIKTNELLKQIIRKLSMIEITMADIRAEVTNINSIGVVEAESMYKDFWIEFDLPLKTSEELNSFEDFLKIEQNMAKSVMELVKFGGDTATEFIKRALQKLITNRLAAEYSWVGLKKKKIFSKLHIVNLLTVSAQKNMKTKLCTVAEIECAIKKHLRRAKERSDAEDRKVNKQ